ncbi:MAG: hypothetical protein HYR98_01795 [Nitrospirae bacterium]|nr:hypothetical protein [Nitrospirota bacterium]MBI3392734.1 hypothetical protein [Nitrospirota bacterium]
MDTTADRNAKVEDFLNQIQGIFRVSLVQSLQDSKKSRLVTTDQAAARAAGPHLVCRSDVLVHFGSTAVRLLVGMGAGRSKLIEVVSLEDPRTGEILLKYTGWGGAVGGFGSQILGKMRSDAFEMARYFSNLVPASQTPPTAEVPFQAQRGSLPPPATSSLPPSSSTVARGAGEPSSAGVSAENTLLIKGLRASKQAGHAGQSLWTLTGTIVNPTGRVAAQASLMAIFLDEPGGEVLRDQQVFPLSQAAPESAFAWKVNAVPQTASKVKVRVVGVTWAEK